MPAHSDLARWYVEPMKALGVASIPRGSWKLEMKFDGWRALVTLDRGRVELWSRNQRPLSAKFPALATALLKLRAQQAVLDGEIVALDDKGRPSFQLLQRLGQLRKQPPLFIYLFDVVRVDGRSLLDAPLEDRQQALRRLLKHAPPGVRLSEVFDVPPQRLLAAARHHGWEGIIAKRAGSLYEPGERSGAWLKCKIRLEQEFVIGGFTPPRSSRVGFGAVLLGYYNSDDELIYAGKVGTGFSHADLLALHEQFKRLQRARCPFRDKPPERNATWVRPLLVCQVAFAEWTSDGLVRQGSFLGLRHDKSAPEVVREVGSA